MYISYSSPVIVLQDVKKSHLITILDYMYKGSVEIDQNEVPEFISLAKSFCIKGLGFPDVDKSGYEVSSSLNNFSDKLNRNRVRNTSCSPSKQETINPEIEYDDNQDCSMYVTTIMDPVTESGPSGLQNVSTITLFF